MKYLPLLLVCIPAVASANPKKLPYSYGTQTMPTGGFELEEYIDVVPLRVLRENADGTLDAIWSTRYALTTEFEYGLTERLELGFYLAADQGAEPGAPFHFSGVKQRARFRISDPSTWPIGLAGYLEVAELQGEIEVEEKLLASWRADAFELVGNLWVEQEYYFADSEWKHIYNPTLGATYELSPDATVGVEYWARGRFDADTDTVHYVGPTAMVQRGEYWFTAGAYGRVDTGKVEVGDPNGRVYVRMIIGIGL